MNKIFFLVLCLFLFVGTAYSYPEEDCPVAAIYDYMYQKFPNVAAIKQQLGEPTSFEEGETDEYPLGPDSGMDPFVDMKFDGIRIFVMNDDLIRIFTISKPGIVEFSGIDIGASRDNVTKIYGEPTNVEGNKVTFESIYGLCEAIFVFEENKVKEMTYNSWSN